MPCTLTLPLFAFALFALSSVVTLVDPVLWLSAMTLFAEMSAHYLISRPLYTVLFDQHSLVNKLFYQQL
jgi:hypothetical protein